MKLPLFLIAGLIAHGGANEVPPVFKNESGQLLPGGQVAVGTQLHLSHPDAGPGMGGIIYYTLDGTDPRNADLANVDALIAYNDERFYHVPISLDDGFLLNPPLSIVPIAYYPFDEDGADHAPSGGSQDAVLSLGTSVTSDALTAGALHLNRDNEHATLGNPSALQITGPISISTWAYATVLSKQAIQYLLVKGPDADSGRSVFLRINYAAGRYEFGASDENGDRFAAFPIPASDRSKWFNLTGVHDGAQWKLYHNGILVASEPDHIGAIPVASDWTLGSRASADGDFLYGSLDEVYFFNAALSDSDVVSLFDTIVPLWTAIDYESARTWGFGPGGHGYNFDEFMMTDISFEMRGVSASVLTRGEFDLSSKQLESINYLELNMVYDDGFVAYLNGTAIHRENAPLVVHGQSKATLPHLPETEEVTFNLEDHVDLLRSGINVLAVQGLNNWIQSDDFLIHSQLRGGGVLFSVAPSASAYSGPVTLDQSMEINARIFHGGEWGHLATVDFQTPNLAITKIHYDPDVDPEVDLFPASAYEFIEIQNIDHRPMSLSGIHLGGAVTCDFPASSLAPGQRFLVPNSTEAFFDHHPDFSSTIVINYQGDLPNQPARIHLYSDHVGTIRDFQYGTEWPAWPDGPNGGGYSLVLIKPETNPDHADPKNWRRSVALNGSPGEDDAISFTGIATNDIDGDGLCALFEYALGTSDTEPTLNPLDFRLVDFVGADPDDRFFLVEVRHQIGTDDVVWIPEISADLQSWSSDPDELGVNRTSATGLDWVTEQYWAVQPISEQERRFIRVRVEKR